ncbi:Ig-like domain-containing protein [Aeromicrobium sp. 50.2.37]|uniref:Ig-like domain-containing protein n=1 Tax=Aeromicrobium sp. 50.2.37 TaxID=2969305 RepID=UPI002150690F|nr:Ig-like domain-containing protein [Aeromicrobium sp. 50.2.37]MCR4514316.1 Ig-like domain-containing protein [Aeromicrobium sp. 50.2.37]
MSMNARHRAPSPQRGRAPLAGVVVLLAALAFSVTGFSSASFSARTVNPVGTVTAASDWTPPTVAVTQPAGGTVSGTTTITATASDAQSGVAQVVLQYQPADASSWVTLCTDTTAPYSCTWDTRANGATPDGPYDLRAIATDKAGYSTTSEVVRTYVANTFAVVLAPLGEVLTGTETASMTVYNAGLTFGSVRLEYAPAGTTRWATACSAFLLINTATTCQWSTTSVPDGAYDLRATYSGSASTVQTDVLVDNTKPAVSMTDPGTPLSGTRTFAATATDAGSGVETVELQYSPGTTGTWKTLCTVTSAPWSCRYDTTALAGGTYAFRAVATDAAGLQSISATVANRVVDNTVSSVSLDDPGQYLTGTVTLTAAANSSAGVASVRIQRAPSGGTTWTDVCSATTAPYTCAFDTRTVGDGSYDLRAQLVDARGTVTTSAVVGGRLVDNSPVRTLDVQSANGGGTVGRLDNGDTVTLTYSEKLNLASVVSGWDGTAKAVTVRLRDGNLVGGGAKDDTLDVTGANLGAVNLKADYVKSGKTVQWAGSMTATTVTVGTSTRTVVTVRLGAVTSGSGLRTVSSTPTMLWTPSATATDLSGQKCSTAPAAETGTADRDF